MMDELLEQISAESNVPVPLLERAAAARASALGVSPEDLVRQWAGVAGDAAPVAAAPAADATPAPAEAPPPPPAVAAEAPVEPETDGTVEVLEPTAPLPEPEAVALEVEDEPDEVLGGVPAWMAAAFALIPLIAVMYALSVPNGPDCGSSGQLTVDPVTGNAVNCDGSAYGSSEGNLIALGEEIYAASCAACHGAGGGGGAGPALNGGAVLTTFSSCADHVAWVSLGTAGWPDGTYGDSEKPVGGFGVMPGFGSSLSDEDRVAVAAYERVAFGGETRDDTLDMCTVESAAEAMGELE
jgi:mono/diheme cytochrome c family protein